MPVITKCRKSSDTYFYYTKNLGQELGWWCGILKSVYVNTQKEDRNRSRVTAVYPDTYRSRLSYAEGRISIFTYANTSLSKIWWDNVGCVTCSSSSRLHPHFSPCVSISIILSLFESDIALQIFATSSLVTLSPLYIDINLSVIDILCIDACQCVFQEDNTKKEKADQKMSLLIASISIQISYLDFQQH